MSRVRKLTPAQASVVRKAVKLRHRLTNKALAARYGISLSTLDQYVRGAHK